MVESESGSVSRPAPGEWRAWLPRLGTLCAEIRDCTREVLIEALARGRCDRIALPQGRGVGDLTYGLDVPSEKAIAAWFQEQARHAPLSVLTEDTGWRHLGPAPDGGEPTERDGFDHGGVRIAFDPVDGTRNLMADLRSAWTVVSFAPPGSGQPRFGDLTGGIISEIPPSRSHRARLFHAASEGAASGESCHLEEIDFERGEEIEKREVTVDADDRPDNGYFPFFRYKPALRPRISVLEAEFFARLETHEGAELLTCYDDQYFSNAGQLVLLILGTYRMIIDPRALVAARMGVESTTSKPYDVAGAMVCARAAGAPLTAADGAPLDFPIDAVTPVDFAGWANPATRRRLEPHWLRVLEQDRAR
jgi:fructose-1,6-bisphosphatase/inositol monophosphatase family enzyme